MKENCYAVWLSRGYLAVFLRGMHIYLNNEKVQKKNGAKGLCKVKKIPKIQK